MADTITASAPGKLLLFGEHAVVYGSACIVTAVDQRLFVTVQLNGENAFRLDAPDLGLMAYSKTIDDLGGEGLPTAVRFIEMFYKFFLEEHPQSRGIDVVTRSEFSSSFGFGSSSAATVAFGKALYEVYGLTVDNQTLFQMCYKTVLAVQGVGSGFDVASAIWGGTIYYVAPGKVIEPLLTGDLPLLVGYTGIKADTPTLVRQVAELKRRDPNLVDGIFAHISLIVDEAKAAIQQRDWMRVGDLMRQNQDLLAKLQVSSVELDRLINAAQAAGAAGAKLSGAGGGDCMVAVSSEEAWQAVKAALSEGGELMNVQLGADGVRIEENQ